MPHARVSWSTRSRGLTLLVVLLLATLPAPVLRAAELATYKSRFYEIHTDLSRDEVLPFGEHMDRIFAEYQRRFSNFRARQRGAMPLYLLRTQEAYLSFMRSRGVRAENSGGMFFSLTDGQGLVTWTQGKSRSETYEVLQHEGFHQFAFNYLGTGLPIWANEGLAQYFEDAILVGGSMRDGLANAERLERVKHALANGTAIPLDALLQTSQDEWNAQLRIDPNRAALLYAQAWSVAYFLIHADNGRYRGAFGNYLTLISEGRDEGDAFETAFGIDDAAPIQRRWERYVRDLEPDPVTAAEADLVFLGVALEYLHEQEVKTPRDIDALKRRLRERRFRVTRVTHGFVTEFDADDDDLFRYDRASGQPMPFEILEPAAANLPPRVRAPGLDPMPTLVWSRNEVGELVMDIRYQ